MPVENARQTEAVIDRDTWGAGQMRDVKTPCPRGCKKIYRIHPSIGVARLGNSDSQFFIGPEKQSFTIPVSFYTLQTDRSKHPVETAIASTADKTIYKESLAGTAIRRQAARFYVFEYRLMRDDTWAWVREITSDEAKIEWTVEVANNKAVFHNFDGPYLGVRRTGRAIKPGKKKITVKHNYQPREPVQHAALEDPTAPIKYLGEILHDEKGHLLFLGGKGTSRGPVPSGHDLDYANNANWNDDISDGPITARLWFPNRPTVPVTTKEHGDAWVMVGPPDFAPELTNITSMYDTMLDVAVRTNMTFRDETDKVIYRMHGVLDRQRVTYSPHFEYDIARIFLATVDTATVYAPANPQMKHPAIQRLAENLKLDDRADPAAAKLRYKVLNTIRPPFQKFKRDPGPDAGLIRLGYPPSSNNVIIGDGEPHVVAPPAGATVDELKRYRYFRWSMPMLFGDANTRTTVTGLGEDYNYTRLAVTETQYTALKKWNEGDFVDTLADDRTVIPVSTAITPGGLERTALERCVGGAFFPGIEASWLTRSPDVYLEPFRPKLLAPAKDFEVTLRDFSEPAAFKARGVTGAGLKVGPGFFSQQMAQPWQADFLDCARDTTAPMIGWWPAARPDDVVRGGAAPADPRALEDPVIAVTTARTVPGATLKGAGKMEISKHSRNVTFSVDGVHPEQAPLTVKVTGKDDEGRDVDASGNPYGETITLPRVRKTVRGDLLYSEITQVEYAPGVPPPGGATVLEATVSIGFGEFMGKMVPWADGVGGEYDMATDKWHRLGFVVGGREIERDPLLP